MPGEDAGRGDTRRSDFRTAALQSQRNSHGKSPWARGRHNDEEFHQASQQACCASLRGRKGIGFCKAHTHTHTLAYMSSRGMRTNGNRSTKKTTQAMCSIIIPAHALCTIRWQQGKHRRTHNSHQQQAKCHATAELNLRTRHVNEPRHHPQRSYLFIERARSQHMCKCVFAPPLCV